MNIDHDELQRIIEQLSAREISKEDALQAVTELGGADLGFARIDHGRESRCGFPEVIYGAGKTTEQLLGITRHFVERGRNLYITRINSESAQAIVDEHAEANYDELARTLTMFAKRPAERAGDIAVLCAGTSDLPVAGECVNTLNFFGFEPRLIADVGVAGIHRLLARRAEIDKADLVIVIAGMEGALPSVVGGLISAPVIAVPTSIGYGAGLNGLAPLMGMLSSCASGIVVVNIDNGFGAACAAQRILNKRQA